MIKLSIWYLCILALGLLSSEIHAGISDWGTEPLDDGARCDVNAVRRANREQLHLLLEELTNTTFFRLFRVGLDGECPMNDAASKSEKKDNIESKDAAEEEEEEEHSCAVDTDTGDAQCSLNLGGKGPAGGDKDLPPWVFHKQPVDRTISVKEQKSVESDLSCETPDFWFDMCHGLVTEDESRGWINLQLNPERHTGYNGSKVWKVIYEQACFADRAMSTNDNACGHEERVLQRLISGLHASINTHISLSFYPPAVSGGEWRPDPARFMETIGSHPDRIKNLNFAFVVLLRALRKAAPVLSSFSYAVSGDANEDLRTGALVRRLLESHLMSSCSQVFDSFDESLMFQNRTSDLKVAFKKAFLSISRTLDCIRCQKCRLHGKMQLTGIGLALKILLLSDEVLAKTPVNRLARREEIVALFNTLHKFSHAIASMDYLTELHLALKDKPASFDTGSVPPSLQQSSPVGPATAAASSSGSSSSMAGSPSIGPSASLSNEKHQEQDLFMAVEAIAKAFYDQHLNDLEEKSLLNLLLLPSATATANSQTEQQVHRTALIALARGYGQADPARFASHVRRLVLDINIPSTSDYVASSPPSMVKPHEKGLTIVVVGSGLAGSSAVLSLLDNTNAEQVQNVILVEKQSFLGGNSVYASSGMNAVDEEARAFGDSVEAFAQDVARSSGKGADFARSPIVRALTGDSESALTWIRQRLGQRFEMLGRLGGHSFARTHRPEQGQAGAELVYGMHRAMRQYQEDGRLQILRGERLNEIIPPNVGTTGGSYSVRMESGLKIDHISAVILACGGYAANKQLLPTNVRRFGTTNGPFSTGDAVSILSKLGAEFKDMDQVQLHPTAFSSSNKDEQQPLCAEILRGVGGILLNSKCERFSDELGTRAYVSQKMIDSREEDFILLLTEEQARSADHFRSVYTKRGLLTEIDSTAVASYLKCPNSNQLKQTLEAYVQTSRNGRDEFNKTNFPMAETFLSTKTFYVGSVQPAVHYCMGGVATDEWGRVQLKEQMGSLRGVYAAGEVSGGLHGNNRLGGNGMTEGLVFGRRVAQAVLKDFGLSTENHIKTTSVSNTKINSDNKMDASKVRIISKQELAKHRFKNDCWVQIRNKVYDFTNFLNEHPGGMKAILDVGGQDGTELYEEIHTMAFLDDFVPIGEISAST